MAQPRVTTYSMPRFGTAKPLEISPRDRLPSRKKMACEGLARCLARRPLHGTFAAAEESHCLRSRTQVLCGQKGGARTQALCDPPLETPYGVACCGGIFTGVPERSSRPLCNIQLGVVAGKKRKEAGLVFFARAEAPRKKACLKGRCHVIETVRKEGTGTKRS